MLTDETISRLREACPLCSPERVEADARAAVEWTERATALELDSLLRSAAAAWDVAHRLTAQLADRIGDALAEDVLAEVQGP